MSKILIIDTTINSCFIALTENNQVVEVVIHQDAKTQGAFINEAIDKMLQRNNTAYVELSAIACCMGPGSYTGLRIGLSTAKGLCYALDIPLIAFDRMECIAPLFNNIILIKARVGEYFIAHYENGITIQRPQHMLYDDVNQYLSNHSSSTIHIIGDDESFEALEVIRYNEDVLYDIKHAVNIVYHRLQQKEFADLAYCEPLYLKSVYTTIAKKKVL